MGHIIEQWKVLPLQSTHLADASLTIKSTLIKSTLKFRVTYAQKTLFCICIHYLSLGNT